MSATERLRELLDERGVEHEGDERSMRWRDRYGIMMQAFPLANGELGMEVWSCIPEQAIAATLGPEDAYTREDVEGAFVSGYSLGLDMYDRTKADADKGWNQNERDMDEEMAERGWVRDRGTCKRVLYELTGVYVCSECGLGLSKKLDKYCFLRFCPNCGRRVMSE